MVHELLMWAESRQHEITTVIRGLVERESPSHDKAVVDRCGAYIAEQFAKAGARVEPHARRDTGDIVECEFAGVGEPVLLLGHLDTVWDVGTLASMPLREDDGRLYGPGVFDMKAGIAIGLFAVRALQSAGQLSRRVSVLLTTDEEVGSKESRELIEDRARSAAAVLVLEPAHGPSGAVKTARKGVGDFTIRVKGVASHAGLDFEKGHSAVLELARQIERISALTDLTHGLTVSAGVIRGGTRRNVVPAEAEAEVDVRITRTQDAADIERLMKSLEPFDPACKIDVGGAINRPPLERTFRVAELYEKARRIAAELGMDLGEAAVGGGSDGNFTGALGVPTLDGLGAVGDGAHAKHEHVMLAELPKRVALVAALIASL